MSETCENFNVLDQFKNNTLLEVQAEQKSRSLPYAVAAMNVEGNLNIGMMLRSATMFCAERFFVLGKRHWDKRSAVGSHNYIETVICPTLTENGVIPREALDELMMAYNYYPIFVELGGVMLHDVHFTQTVKAYHAKTEEELSKYPRPCLIFGNEHFGISKEYIGSDTVISVEQGGVMRSLNVSATAAIVCNHFYQEFKFVNRK